MNLKIKKINHGLSGTLSFPGDKSLSHRAIIFGSLAEGESHFTNVLAGEDCVYTRKAFEAMGVKIRSNKDGTELWIEGKGLRLDKPGSELYLGNSGTSVRLLLGVLAGQNFEATLTGDPSLSLRPMRRVTDYLKQMGAHFEGKDTANFAPIKIKGGKLKAIDAKLSVASAQVKSAILLAGLYADGVTSVTEPTLSRNHTESFLKSFGANVHEEGLTVSIEAGNMLKAKSETILIPGDISSAAFFMVATLLVKDSNVNFKSVLNNSTRTGIFQVLKRMGASLVTNSSTPYGGPGVPEPSADFTLTSHQLNLNKFEIKKQELPTLIDEIPILCVLATQANGKSIIHDADELRVKETDRIHSMVSQLSRMGAKIKAEGNTLIIEGPTALRGAEVESFKDHRTAMSLVVAGMIADGETVVRDIECINTSFPNFFQLLKKVGAPYELC